MKITIDKKAILEFLYIPDAKPQREAIFQFLKASKITLELNMSRF